MAYKFLTQYDSPNYTPAAQTRSVWGVDRQIKHIAIHWWGDPNQNPTFEGVIATLCNPARQASANFVATGTDRRVACIVGPADNSWATNSDNPYSISIECDPRCRPEDYDVVGELIAELRATYGDLQLVPHKQFIATTCPGNYDLNRLNQVAATKIARAEDQFGLAKDKNPPAPAKKTATKEEIDALYLQVLERAADPGAYPGRVGIMSVDEVRATLLASQEYSVLQNKKVAAQADAIKKAQELEAKAKADADAKRIADEKAAQQTAIELAKQNSPLDVENNAILKWIQNLLKKIFNVS